MRYLIFTWFLMLNSFLKISETFKVLLKLNSKVTAIRGIIRSELAITKYSISKRNMQLILYYCISHNSKNVIFNQQNNICLRVLCHFSSSISLESIIDDSLHPILIQLEHIADKGRFAGLQLHKNMQPAFATTTKVN